MIKSNVYLYQCFKCHETFVKTKNTSEEKEEIVCACGFVFTLICVVFKEIPEGKFNFTKFKEYFDWRESKMLSGEVAVVSSVSAVSRPQHFVGS